LLVVLDRCDRSPCFLPVPGTVAVVPPLYSFVQIDAIVSIARLLVVSCLYVISYVAVLYGWAYVVYAFNRGPWSANLRTIFIVAPLLEALCHYWPESLC